MSQVARVNVVAEGQTEETFVRDLLTEFLAHRGAYVAVRCVMTGRRRETIYRGGMTSYARARRDIQRWLHEDPSAHLTTLFDLYRLPGDFPGLDQAKALHDPYARVQCIEADLAADIQHPRFIPYIQLHEFESLLFSDVQIIDRTLSLYARSQLDVLQQIRAQFKTPEEINDGETSAPSKRLKCLYPGYDKVAFGPLIAQRIGLEALRRECPHFDGWVAQLEALADREPI
jgi:hypothetical protein